MSRASRTLTVIFTVTAGLSPLILTGTSHAAAGPRLPERALGVVASWHRAVALPGVAEHVNTLRPLLRQHRNSGLGFPHSTF